MILHAIELSRVGPFRETVRVGPFAAGLNILSAPNESGKTTVLRAAARGLFDKHTTRAEELKALQPAGTELAPRVMVDFSTAAGRFRIEKTFLLSPRSHLQQWLDHRWQPLAEGDQADARVLELLRATASARGASKPEHWGLLGFLWARQGERADWPALDDAATGQPLRARLVRVELDPLIEKLRARLAAVADSLLTSTGQSKAGGALREAEDQLASLEAELQQVRQTRAELDSTQERYQRSVSETARLEKELGEVEARAIMLAEHSVAADRQRVELEFHQAALQKARDHLAALSTEAATLQDRRAALTDRRAAVDQAAATVKTAQTHLAALREPLESVQASRPGQERSVLQQRQQQRRLQDLLRWRALQRETQAWQSKLATVDKAVAEIARIEAQRTRVPALQPTQLRALTELHERERLLAAQLQALGLTVEATVTQPREILRREGDTNQVERLTPGQPTRLHSPQALDLELSGWGRLTIRSGGQEAATTAKELADVREKLREAFHAATVTSLEAARDAAAQRKDLDAQLRLAQGWLSEQLGTHRSLEALRESAATAQRGADALAVGLQPTDVETSAPVSALELQETDVRASLALAEQALASIDATVIRLRNEERAAALAVQTAVQVQHERITQLKALESEIAALAERHSGGLEAARARAQQDFVETEARQAAARARLPADFDQLPDRLRRARQARQQLTTELLNERGQRDQSRGVLATLGGQGLYSRETDLEERRTEVLLRRDAARARARSARLAQNLIEHRKDAATRALLAPLEQRLTDAFSELTGVSNRRVFLNEQLHVTGIGPSVEAQHAFDLLSQGAREQLLLCLRIAVAEELATTEPQVLILDDVLVNTDPVRQERILATLEHLSARLQIVVLTCHASAYRGAGESVQIRPHASG